MVENIILKGENGDVLENCMELSKVSVLKEIICEPIVTTN